MTNHTFRHEPRQYLTDQEKAELFLEKNGKCHMCKRKLGPADKWIVEHLTANERIERRMNR